MHGLLLSDMAVIAIPDASHFFRLAGPAIAGAAFLFVWSQLDAIINRLFPGWAWQKKLGWLNFAAIRRAETFMRWLGYFVYAILAVALFGIIWVAQSFPAINDLSDQSVVMSLLVRVPILLVCLGFWMFYLLGELFPKMISQYEEEELEKFRTEQHQLEQEERMNPKSRMKEQPLRIEITPSRPKPKR